VREAVAVLLEGEYAEPSMRVELPDGRELPAATVFVANCSPWSFAGPLELDVAPEARFEGGFDLVVVESVQAKEAPGRLRALFAKQDEEPDGVTRLHDLERAVIRCDRPTPVQVDGELLGELDEIELGVVRDAVRFLA
jgi:diacylglycerol kinase family enzyme